MKTALIEWHETLYKHVNESATVSLNCVVQCTHPLHGSRNDGWWDTVDTIHVLAYQSALVPTTTLAE